MQLIKPYAPHLPTARSTMDFGPIVNMIFETSACSFRTQDIEIMTRVTNPELAIQSFSFRG